MASVPGFAAATKVSLLSNRCFVFTILSVCPNARRLQKELGKKLQLSVFDQFYYLLLLDCKLTLSFAHFCFPLLFNFSSSPLLFTSFYLSICWLLFILFLVIFAIVIVIPSLPCFPCFFYVCFDRLNKSLLRTK